MKDTICPPLPPLPSPPPLFPIILLLRINFRGTLSFFNVFLNRFPIFSIFEGLKYLESYRVNTCNPQIWTS